MKLPTFSLRDLFWLVLVAACLCGWGLERVRLAAEWRRVEQERRDINYIKSVNATDSWSGQRNPEP